MDRRGLATLVIACAACGAKPAAQTAPASTTPRPGLDKLPDRIAWDFEHAVLESEDAMLALFDFSKVGEMEILIHRYDALGRIPDLDPDVKEDYLDEDGTPYPPERERHNIGAFYADMIRPAMAHGGCRAMTPSYDFDRQLGEPYPPLPPGNEDYEPLRQKINSYLDHGQGGVIAVRCPGGDRGLALVYTRAANERGYELITIYDDGPDPKL